MNASSISSSGQAGASSSPPAITTTASSASSNSNRLLFNRLATERKTVHVMSANLNKDVSKRDRQILASYNHATANSSTAGTGAAAAAATNLTNNNYQNNFLNNQSTLDYNGMMTTGRSQTNASTFLQKLSSKFTRRYKTRTLFLCVCV